MISITMEQFEWMQECKRRLLAVEQWAARAVNHIESTKYHYAGLSGEMTQCERLLNDPTAIEIRVEHDDIEGR